MVASVADAFTSVTVLTTPSVPGDLTAAAEFVLGVFYPFYGSALGTCSLSLRVDCGPKARISSVFFSWLLGLLGFSWFRRGVSRGCIFHIGFVSDMTCGCFCFSAPCVVRLRIHVQASVREVSQIDMALSVGSGSRVFVGKSDPFCAPQACTDCSRRQPLKPLHCVVSIA